MWTSWIWYNYRVIEGIWVQVVYKNSFVIVEPSYTGLGNTDVNHTN